MDIMQDSTGHRPVSDPERKIEKGPSFENKQDRTVLLDSCFFISFIYNFKYVNKILL